MMTISIDGKEILAIELSQFESDTFPSMLSIANDRVTQYRKGVPSESAARAPIFLATALKMLEVATALADLNQFTKRTSIDGYWRKWKAQPKTDEPYIHLVGQPVIGYFGTGTVESVNGEVAMVRVDNKTGLDISKGEDLLPHPAKLLRLAEEQKGGQNGVS